MCGARHLARARRWVVRWIAERVAEQRLLWNLAGADEATLHVPENLDKAAAETMMRDAMRRDADRHLRLLALHTLGLLLSVPFVVIPGPNVFGYFFTFTVLGHYMAWRGARRALSRTRWTMSRAPISPSCAARLRSTPPRVISASTMSPSVFASIGS